jgi:nucleotide-binding universal stress UspA family protein
LELKKAGEQELETLINALSSTKVSARTILRHGIAAREIARTARELGSDLILISSQGSTGWKRALVGSTTEEVVRRAPCPVLVFRESQKLSLTKKAARSLRRKTKPAPKLRSA